MSIKTNWILSAGHAIGSQLWESSNESTSTNQISKKRVTKTEKSKEERGELSEVMTCKLLDIDIYLPSDGGKKNVCGQRRKTISHTNCTKRRITQNTPRCSHVMAPRQRLKKMKNKPETQNKKLITHMPIKRRTDRASGPQNKPQIQRCHN